MILIEIVLVPAHDFYNWLAYMQYFHWHRRFVNYIENRVDIINSIQLVLVISELIDRVKGELPPIFDHFYSLE